MKDICSGWRNLITELEVERDRLQSLFDACTDDRFMLRFLASSRFPTITDFMDVLEKVEAERD